MSDSRTLETDTGGALVAELLGVADHPVVAREIVELVQRIRSLDLKKTPSISETLDWARALMALNAAELANVGRVAVSSALLGAEDPARQASRLRAALEA